MKLNPIIPGLYLRGRLPRRWTVDECHVALRDSGVTMVISLVHEPRNLNGDVLQHIYLPIPDGKRVDSTIVPPLAADIADWLNFGEQVVVHCNAGRNRAGLVATGVVMRHWSFDAEDALAYVRRKRPNAVANPHFERWILEGGFESAW